MARIAVDCDGVLANFIRAFVELFNRLHPGRNITEEAWTSWGGGGQFTKAEESAMWRVIQQTENFWLGVDAYSDCVGDLAQWLMTQRDQDVWIMTSRANSAGMTTTKQTQIWLDACGVRPIHNYLGVITVPNSDDKVDICSRLDIDWMIDDKTETIESMDRFPYLHAALLDRRWNQDAQVKWRVKSMVEFLGAIK